MAASGVAWNSCATQRPAGAFTKMRWLSTRSHISNTATQVHPLRMPDDQEAGTRQGAGSRGAAQPPGRRAEGRENEPVPALHGFSPAARCLPVRWRGEKADGSEAPTRPGLWNLEGSRGKGGKLLTVADGDRGSRQGAWSAEASEACGANAGAGGHRRPTEAALRPFNPVTLRLPQRISRSVSRRHSCCCYYYYYCRRLHRPNRPPSPLRLRPSSDGNPARTGSANRFTNSSSPPPCAATTLASVRQRKWRRHFP